MSTFGVYNVKYELEFEKCESCKHLSKTYLKLQVKIIKRCDNFSVMAGSYLPERVLFCYGSTKLFAQLTHAVEVSCIWSFFNQGNEQHGLLHYV